MSTEDHAAEAFRMGMAAAVEVMNGEEPVCPFKAWQPEFSAVWRLGLAMGRKDVVWPPYYDVSAFAEHEEKYFGQTTTHGPAVSSLVDACIVARARKIGAMIYDDRRKSGGLFTDANPSGLAPYRHPDLVAAFCSGFESAKDTFMAQVAERRREDRMAVENDLRKTNTNQEGIAMSKDLSVNQGAEVTAEEVDLIPASVQLPARLRADHDRAWTIVGEMSRLRARLRELRQEQLELTQLMLLEFRAGGGEVAAAAPTDLLDPLRRRCPSRRCVASIDVSSSGSWSTSVRGMAG